MKKLSCILLAVMLITAMFVSCTAEVIDPYDGLAYVTFGGPASKDLTASYEVQSYEDLYWFYTATKADEYGKTGETGENEEIPLAGTAEKPEKGLGGKIGPFSQGKWDFVLTAYNSVGSNKTLVYKGSVDGVKLTKSEVKSVPVSVTPQGKTGTIEFRNAFFKWNEDNGGGAKPTIKITAVGPQTYTLLSGLGAPDENGNVPLKWNNNNTLSIDQSYIEIPVGYYKCTVVAWVVDESSPIFEQSFGIRVYGSATTVISGDIMEKVDSFVDFEVSQEDLVVFKGASTMEVLSTPANASDKVTTVDFGSSLEADKTYSLSVKSTTAAEAATKFTVSDGKAAVAGIDLTLTDTSDNKSVTSFRSEITITTYIAPGLNKDNLKVLYGNDGKNYLVDYDSITGKLVFTTNHFSEYYVVADAIASIGSTGYAFLQDAIDAAESGATVTLLCDASGDGIGLYKKPKNGQTATKDITIDFNKHTYTIDGDLQGSTGTVTQAFHLEKDCTVILKNGKLTSKKAKMLIQNYCNLTLDGMVLDFVESGFGYALSNNCGEVRIKDTTIKVAEGKIAFDSCKFGSYSIPTVTISGASEIDGKIELSGGKLVCPETLKSKISYYAGFESKYDTTIESGILTAEPLS